jgi:hypothetical protein
MRRLGVSFEIYSIWFYWDGVDKFFKVFETTKHSSIEGYIGWRGFRIIIWCNMTGHTNRETFS